MGVATEFAKAKLQPFYTYCLLYASTDARRPPLEEVIPEDALQDIDPQLRGSQGYRLWYLKCRNCGGRAVCKELDDGTRIEFRIIVPHRCDTDEINRQAKAVENILVDEASDPADILSSRRIY